MKNRIEYIDTARGLGMVLVIWGHCIGDYENSVNRFILSFHMPLFFIISSFFYKKSSSNISFFSFLKKQIQRLWYPQLTLSVGSLIIGFVYNFLYKNNEINVSWQEILLYIFWGFWFLPVLFYVNTIAFLINKLRYSVSRLIFCITIIIFIVVLKEKGYIPLMQYGFCITILPMALFIFICGTYMHNVYNKKNSSEYLLIFILLITIIISQINKPALMFIADYGNIILFVLSAFLGTYFTIQLSMLINSKLLLFIGRNSIIIYVAHFWIKDYINTLNLQILSFFNLTNNYTILYTLNFALVFSVSLTIANLVHKYCILKKIFGISD